MTYKYQDQINKLKWVIDNWEFAKYSNDFDLKRKFINDLNVIGCDTQFSIEVGLCDNCQLNDIDDINLYDMFESFPKYSGDTVFPLEEFERYSEMKNYTETPERLELARHCLKFLEETDE